MSEQRKIRVAVVFGGRGPEHAVSVMGGGNMLNAIDRSKYEVIPIGITRDGNWVQVADEPARLALSDGQLPSVEAAAVPGSQVVPWAGGEVIASAPAQIPTLFGDVDVVLPVLHGPYGEDGTIQGLLEMAGVRYVGCGVLASAVSMDKEYMKLIFKAKGLPVGPYVVVTERNWPVGELADGQLVVERKRVLDEIAELGWPLFVKPARGGSSIGTSKARDLGELHEAIAHARQYDPKVLVEAAVDGVEIEVAVLEGDDGVPETSLPGQVVVADGADFWDFDGKYLNAATDMAIPAPVPDEVNADLRRLAAAAFQAVSAEGLARVDFFYTRDGHILVNEINTMPGLAPTSYWQRMWVASGKTLPELIDRLLSSALRKRPGLR